MDVFPKYYKTDHGTCRITQEMANLNFDTKYTRGGMDEIGVLGNNFNKMSEKLKERCQN